MIAAILAAALAFTPGDAHLAYETAKEIVEDCTPRDAGTLRARLAANRILDLASATGADVRLERFTAMTPRGERNFFNLSSEFCANPEGEWVVIVSHFDTKPGVNCPGANDGASTTGLLVALANALERWQTPRGNVMLLWTDGEECWQQYGENDGLWGSRHAAAKLVESGRKVRAVIALDMLGDRDLKISIPRNSTESLAELAEYAAGKAKLEGLVGHIREIVKDDHAPFMAAGFKGIDLIDFEYGSKPGRNDYWHTEADTMDKISEASLEKAGRLVVEMLNALLI